MRKIKLKDWIKDSPDRPRKKTPKDRPSTDWELTNSIKFIRMRDKYLREEGILVKIGERKWKLNL